MNKYGGLARLTLLQALALALLVKLVIASLLPMTGDEAYFVLWGRHLDYGYYDHPPMAGWMTWLMAQLSEQPVVMRLPGIATELLIALGLYAQWRRVDAEKARLIALVFSFSPLSLIFVFTLTDTGCMLFAAASYFAAARALTLQAAAPQTQVRAAYAWAALAGIALGLAFLSKYFTVFLGLAFLLYFFFVRPSAWRLGLVLMVVAIPFGLLNLFWNMNHCWTNLLFNLVNRNRGEIGIQWGDALMYVAMMTYVVLPPLMLAWCRAWRQAVPVELQPSIALARVVVLTALLGFLLVSFKKTVGLHWVLWFYPMVLVGLFTAPLVQWLRWLRWVGVLAAVHVTLILAILVTPLSVWQQYQPKLAKDLMAATQAPSLLAAAQRQVTAETGMTPLQAEHLPLAAQGYTWASVLSYQLKQPVMVMGPGSKYARQDDFWTDFRALDGQSVLIYLKRPRELETVAAWFHQVRAINVLYQGQHYAFALAEGFSYPRYHDLVLRAVRADYYAFPAWLPADSCPVTQRYFDAEVGTVASP